MLNPDELIESGFASLRNALPSKGPAELVVKARIQNSRAKLVKTLIGSASCLTFVGVMAIALQPTSAIAALRESARLTASQQFVHIHFDRKDIFANPTNPPYPSRPPIDIWRLGDSYVRMEGHTLSQVFKSGKILSFDERFPFGATAPYNAPEDHFWDFDGSIGVELARPHKSPPKVRDLGDSVDYEWQDVDGMKNSMTTHIFVDSKTLLVRGANNETITASGDRSFDTASVDYPRPEYAHENVPPFPKGLKFRSKEEVLREFHRDVVRPEQTKTVAGIRVNFYGVLVYPNVPGGIGVDVITTGGTIPDYGSGHQAQILGVPHLAAKRSDWFPAFVFEAKTRFGDVREIRGKRYVVNQSNDLLAKAPTKVIVKVPVWKGNSHTFVGYATFTTSKVFFNPAGGQWNFYDKS